MVLFIYLRKKTYKYIKKSWFFVSELKKSLFFIYIKHIFINYFLKSFLFVVSARFSLFFHHFFVFFHHFSVFFHWIFPIVPSFFAIGAVLISAFLDFFPFSHLDFQLFTQKKVRFFSLIRIFLRFHIFNLIISVIKLFFIFYFY